MNRLTRPTVNVDETAAQYMGKEVDLRIMNERLLELILNGPTLNAVPKDMLRRIIRQLYGELQAYEDIGLEPEEVKDMAENAETSLLTWFESRYGFPVGKLMTLCEAEQEGRLVVVPCKRGDAVWAIRNFKGTKHPQKGFVDEMFFLPDMTLQIVVKHIARGEFGKTVFHTFEEAEGALEREAER